MPWRLPVELEARFDERSGTLGVVTTDDFVDVVLVSTIAVWAPAEAGNAAYLVEMDLPVVI